MPPFSGKDAREKRRFLPHKTQPPNDSPMWRCGAGWARAFLVRGSHSSPRRLREMGRDVMSRTVGPRDAIKAHGSRNRRGRLNFNHARLRAPCAGHGSRGSTFNNSSDASYLRTKTVTIFKPPKKPTGGAQNQLGPSRSNESSKTSWRVDKIKADFLKTGVQNFDSLEREM